MTREGLAEQPDPAGPRSNDRSYGDSGEELVRRARDGCRDSFDALVQRYGGRVFSYLLMFTGHREDAEDLTQITFLKAYRRLPHGPVPVAVLAWLITIARRSALNHFRSRRAHESFDDEVPSGQPSPAAHAGARDEWEALWRLADRLKPAQREVLWLRYAQGLSVSEIAGATGLHSIHVRVLLHRARHELLKRVAARQARFPHEESRPSSARRRQGL